MLLFQVGSARYAMPGDDIVEVIPDIPLTPLSTTPRYVAGMFNYAGVPIPVLDLGLLFQEQPCKPALHTRLIIVQGKLAQQLVTLGLRAEKVTTVFEIDPLIFRQEGQLTQPWPFLGGMLTADNILLQLVDGSKLLAWYYHQVKPS